MNNTLPSYAKDCKPAKSFAVDDVIICQKSKQELLANTASSRSFHRYMIVKCLGIGCYGYKFWVRDLDSAELKQQGFGSQILWIIEKG